ncbi:MAG TPA: toll/interleukin-1 receptor domain-containing protein [Arachnia sp.]|nr:toll/interleukin-1 receptor domain-containing protein [Arachnia sp.]
MSIDQRHYSVFISYARRDDADGTGWVTTLVDALRADAQPFGDADRIFFDKTELETFEDWEAQLSRQLRHSEVLMVCASHAYFASEPCLWEWRANEAKAANLNFPSSVVPVLLENVAGTDVPEAHLAWRDRVYAPQTPFDLQKLFPHHPRTVSLDPLKAQVGRLSEEIMRRREEARHRDRWINTHSNLDDGTSRFVGRAADLAEVNKVLTSPEVIRKVAVVSGPGGYGKTELLRQHGRLSYTNYSGGIWQLDAEGHTEILPLLVQLVERLRITVPDEIRDSPTKIGQLVLRELHARTNDQKPLLLIFDNVSKDALLSPVELDKLRAGTYLHLAASTRLGPTDFIGNDRVTHIPLKGLSDDAAVELIRLHQLGPLGDQEPDFRSTDDKAAAHELARVLDGFTLAVELAAVYLMTNPEISVRQYLDLESPRL